MKRVFKEDKYETEFKKNGFIVIPVFSNNEIEDFKQSLLNFKPQDNYLGFQETAIGKQSFHVTFFDEDANYKASVFQYIQSKLNSKAETLLENYKCVQANVFLKPPHSGFVYPHQNLTITDETKYTSVSFWLPLQATNFENGTICLVPGSQHDFEKFRNTHVYWPYVKFFKEGKGLNYFKAIEVKAGELLIIDDRIIHYTPLNQTNFARWVMHALYTPKEAPIWFCDPKENDVLIYEVSDQFWQFHLPGTFPKKENTFVLKNAIDKQFNEAELELKLNEIQSALSKS